MDMKIVHVSVAERAKLYFLSLVYGWYLIVRRLISWAWNPSQFFFLRQRDKPPSCLVDNTLGTHSYVKLRVTPSLYRPAFIAQPLSPSLWPFPRSWSASTFLICFFSLSSFFGDDVDPLLPSTLSP
jgi:hypothetical protein